MRIRYYDWLEAVAIFLVCSVHGVWLRGNVASSIAMSLVPMAVPLFFMVHGALLLTKQISTQKQLKRFFRVVGQVLGWNAFYLILSLITGLVDPESITLGYLYNYFICFAVSGGVDSGHLWFIYALLSIYIFLPILEACRDRGDNLLKYLWLVCFASTFLRYEVMLYGNWLGPMIFGENKTFDIEMLMRNLSPMGEYANCILFFLTGHFLSQWLQRNPQLREHRIRWSLLCLLGIVLSLALLMLERYIDFGKLEFNWKPLPNQYRRVGALTMAACTFILFSLIDFKDGKLYRVVKAISMHTLDIYYIHIIYVRFLYILFYRHDRAGVIPNYIRAALVLVLSYATGQILRRIPIVKKLLT